MACHGGRQRLPKSSKSWRPIRSPRRCGGTTSPAGVAWQGQSGEGYMLHIVAHCCTLLHIVAHGAHGASWCISMQPKNFEGALEFLAKCEDQLTSEMTDACRPNG